MDAFELSRAVLVLRPERGAVRKVEFQLEGGGRAKLENWLGPPSKRDLVAALRRRYAWTLPLALAFVISALPLPVAGPGAKFGAFSFFLGVGLALSWMVSKLWPHRGLFLVEALGFASLGGGFVWRVATGQAPLLLLAWLPFGAVLIVSGCKQFRRFAEVRRK